MIAYVPIIVMIAGLLVWAIFSSREKSGVLPEAGEIAYFVGLFWSVYPFVGKMLKLLTVTMVLSLALTACGFCQQAANKDTARCKAQSVVTDCGAPEVIKAVESIVVDVAAALASSDWSNLLAVIEGNLINQGQHDVWGLISCAISKVTAKPAPGMMATVVNTHGGIWMKTHPAKIKNVSK